MRSLTANNDSHQRKMRRIGTKVIRQKESHAPFCWTTDFTKFHDVTQTYVLSNFCQQLFLWWVVNFFALYPLCLPFTGPRTCICLLILIPVQVVYFIRCNASENSISVRPSSAQYCVPMHTDWCCCSVQQDVCMHRLQSS